MTSDGQIRSARIAQVAAGTVFGAGLGYTVGRLFKHHALDLGALGWSDSLAGFLGVTLLGGGLLIAMVTMVSSLSRTMIAPFAGRELTPAIARFYRLQGFVSLLAGIMLVLPVTAIVLPLNASARTAIFALIVSLFALQTYGNLLIWRRSDEFLRKIIADTGALCFWVLQGALFLWAAGEHMAILPRLSSWDAVAILMLVYAVASASISFRRGVC